MSNEIRTRGLETRKRVLGEKYVSKVMRQSADEFGAPLQDLLVEYCRGAIWTRPGLEPKTRSIINLAILSALNRPHEFKLHVRGALNNGVTKQEITETLLQVAVYCGVPAGVEALRLAREELELDPADAS